MRHVMFDKMEIQWVSVPAETFAVVYVLAYNEDFAILFFALG